LTPDANTGSIFWTSPSKTNDVGAKIQYNYGALLMTIGTQSTNADLRFVTGNASEAVRILHNGNVGIGTTAPGQIFDVNQGSGNMIADGYDSHSLAKYKEDIREITDDLLETFQDIKVYKYKRKPYVSADELATLARGHFSEEQWLAAFPNDDYRDGKLEDCLNLEIKLFIDQEADRLRSERRKEDKWKIDRVGLIVDDSLKAVPQLIARDDKGEISGVSLSEQVGLLYAVVKQLITEVDKLKKV